MTTITITTWGYRHLNTTIRVRAYPDERAIQAVCRSIARRTRLDVVSYQDQGTALSHGRPESQHYSLQLGRPVPRKLGGGWSGAGEVWVAIPFTGGR